MYKLEVKLKQHTPLIHFQHEHSGATLRASEVKPKLDRFVLEKLGGFEEVYSEAFKVSKKDSLTKYEAGIYGAKKLGWLIGDGSNPALDYKMRISCNEQIIDKYIIGSNISKKKIRNVEVYESQGYEFIYKSPYFADDTPIQDLEKNMEDVKLGVMLRKGNQLTLSFFCTNMELKDIISNYVNSFFALNNFGNRQNKGFGCFFPMEATEDDFYNSFDEDIYPSIYFHESNSDLSVIFKEINSIYKNLKSGGQNSESELRNYFNKQGIEWEKPKMQEKTGRILRRRMTIDKKADKDKFVRALLGLPELYEYTKDKIKVRVKSEEGAIERYPSPILFKVFNNCIYMTINNRQASDILNKKFYFEFSEDKTNHPHETFQLVTPSEFDIYEFIEYAMRKNEKWEKL